jgi:hypothetical protein
VGLGGHVVKCCALPLLLGCVACNATTVTIYSNDFSTISCIFTCTHICTCTSYPLHAVDLLSLLRSPRNVFTVAHILSARMMAPERLSSAVRQLLYELCLHFDASSLGLHCGGDASFSARLLGLKSCAVSLPFAYFCGLQCGGGDTTSLGARLLGMSV